MNKYWTCEFCDFTHLNIIKVCLCSEALQKHHEKKSQSSSTKRKEGLESLIGIIDVPLRRCKICKKEISYATRGHTIIEDHEECWIEN